MVAKLSLRLGKSTLLWLVLLLCVAELVSKGYWPLANIAHERQKPNQLTQEALAYKADCLAKLDKAPDVLVLGSSLPMAAIRYCDNQWVPQTEADNDALKHHLSIFQSYCRGVYLEKQLSEAAGHGVSVFNFTSAACMPSDASLILSKTIELKKVPKLVIIGFGPRDFMDNLVPEMGRTPAFTALADWQCLSGNLPHSLTPDTIRELMLTATSQCYRKRADWALLFSQITENFVRPVKVAAPKASAAKEGGIPVAVAANGKEQGSGRYEAWHIEDYTKRYNPPNSYRYEQELERFVHLLDTCKQKNIAVVVVNMPITSTNKELIPISIFKRYQSDLPAVALKYGAEYVDLSISPIFTADDFLDTVHVNPQGGKKVHDQLLRTLEHSELVAKVLDANSVKSIGLSSKREKDL